MAKTKTELPKITNEELNEYVPVIEAILFAAGFPVKFENIAKSLEISEDMVKAVIASDRFAYKGRGIRLVVFSDSCQLCTNETYEKQVKIALGMRYGGALSNSALEVLAIVAYNQPVTKAFIEQVRGVDSTYAVTTLTEKSLIEVKGKLDVPGKPNLYGTTDTFLRCFGLSSLDELPKNEVLEAVKSADTEPEEKEPEQMVIPELSEEAVLLGEDISHADSSREEEKN